MNLMGTPNFDEVFIPAADNSSPPIVRVSAVSPADVSLTLMMWFAPSTCKAVAGEAVPMPTRSLAASTCKVVPSTVRPLPAAMVTSPVKANVASPSTAAIASASVYAVAPVAIAFNLLWSASVKTLESVAASTAARISSFVWSAVAAASMPSNLE